MSSTLRGYERHKSDYYITPVDEIIKFLNEFKEIEKLNGFILEPCAGGGWVKKNCLMEKGGIKMSETLLVSICGGFVGGLISLFVSFVVLLIVVDKNKKEE